MHIVLHHRDGDDDARREDDRANDEACRNIAFGHFRFEIDPCHRFVEGFDRNEQQYERHKGEDDHVPQCGEQGSAVELPEWSNL